MRLHGCRQVCALAARREIGCKVAHMFDLTLTFDNGPEPETTPQVLDVLARRGVRTTFFVIGEKLAMPGRRALAERARAEGHWIGNHTWTHSGPLGARREADLSDDEIGRTQRELGGLASPHRYFRPQGGGGKLGPHLLRADNADYLQRGGYTCVLWNSIPRDWDDADGWIGRAMDHVRAQDWTLMVLHDVPSGAMRHLDRFLAMIGEAGGRLRQEFPPDCTPMVDGIITGTMAGLVASRE
jgi:peptidoglycan/xylan/chitin deacetylase (PgdA/CDA1 family)